MKKSKEKTASTSYERKEITLKGVTEEKKRDPFNSI